MSSELHLMILWANARYKQDEILEDLKKTHLQILECFDITWTPDKVANNFTRFYGVKLDSGSSKEVECGTGSFLLITMLDNNPKYENAQTSRGVECVNVNLFNLKTKYREWTRGGHKIHATNNPSETNHDIALLLGKNYDDYLKSAPKKWNGKIKQLSCDLIGCNGWKNFHELFYTLNATTNYVVLRGQELINHTNSEDGDIDIFTTDYSNLIFLINGRPEINPHRPHFYTKLGNKYYYLDVWDAGNTYYDEKWQLQMLSSKSLTSNLYWELNKVNKFYELIYHCLIHKNYIRQDYYDKALALYHNIFNLHEADNTPYPFDIYYKLLSDFMQRNQYQFIKPEDISVFYNEKIVAFETQIQQLEKLFSLTDVKPFMINNYNGGGSGYVYYSATLNNKKVFIKSGGTGNSAQNEFEITKKLYSINSKNFLNPIASKITSEYKYILFEFVEGTSLETLLNENLTAEQKTNLISQLEDIARSLLKAKIVHRDIRPANLILTKNNQLKLIDMQWAVYADNYTEDNYVLDHIENFYGLGTSYALAPYCWDDMYSIRKIIKELGEDSAFITKSLDKLKISLNPATEIFRLKQAINMCQQELKTQDKQLLLEKELASVAERRDTLRKKYKKYRRRATLFAIVAAVATLTLMAVLFFK